MGTVSPTTYYRDKIIAFEKNKDFAAAYEVLAEALGLYPTNPFFLRTEVFVLLRLKKVKEARVKAEQRLEALKNDVFFLKTYLLILEKSNAAADIQRLLQIIPSWNIADEAFSEFLDGFTQRVFRQENPADVLKTRPALNSFNYYKDMFKGKAVEAAIQELENIRILPEYAQDEQMHLYLAGLYKQKKDYAKAVEVYVGLLKQKDNPFTRKMLGYAYYKMNDLPHALFYLKDIFFDEPNDHFLYRTLSGIYEKNRDYTGFERLIMEALAKKPQAKHLYGLLKKAKQWAQS